MYSQSACCMYSSGNFRFSKHNRVNARFSRCYYLHSIGGVPEVFCTNFVARKMIKGISFWFKDAFGNQVLLILLIDIWRRWLAIY